MILLWLCCFCFAIIPKVSGRERCVYITGKSVTCNRVPNYRLRDYSSVTSMNIISYTNMNLRNPEKICAFLPRTVRWFIVRNVKNQFLLCQQIKSDCLFKIQVLRGCEDTSITTHSITMTPNRITTSSPPITTTPTSPPESFSEWGAWSDYGSCDAVCGPGFQSRTRKCIGRIPCGETETETQYHPCQLDICAKLSSWGSWTSSECSATCGEGIQTISRRCIEGDCSNYKTSQDRPCKSLKPCPSVYSVWGYWGPCSSTCGTEGLKKRSRKCQSGDECLDLDQLANCSRISCQTHKEWSHWSPCSVSCGDWGTEERTRICHEDHQSGGCLNLTETRPCNISTPCNFFTSWTNFTACSASECGPGESIRSRECVVEGLCDPEDLRDSMPCMIRECTMLSSWFQWSECSATCGFEGIRHRSRDCISGPNCHQEILNITETCKNNKNQNCLGEWFEWGYCYPRCGEFRERTRNRTCVGPLCPFNITRTKENCANTSCDVQYEPWGSWSSCEKSCGRDAGLKWRFRECSNSKHCPIDAELTEEWKCSFNFSCGTWKEWSFWSDCTISCGRSREGRRYRLRNCTEPDDCQGQSKEVKICSPLLDCPLPQRLSRPGKWQSWGACTASCSPSGIQVRTRQCRGTGDICHQIRDCLGLPICDKKKWSQWSPCTSQMSCGVSGVRYRWDANGVREEISCVGYHGNCTMTQDESSDEATTGSLKWYVYVGVVVLLISLIPINCLLWKLCCPRAGKFRFWCERIWCCHRARKVFNLTDAVMEMDQIYKDLPRSSASRRGRRHMGVHYHRPRGRSSSPSSSQLRREIALVHRRPPPRVRDPEDVENADNEDGNTTSSSTGITVYERYPHKTTKLYRKKTL